MTIYLDAVWTLNLFLDWLLLLCTQAIARLQVPKLRIFAGAVVASLIVPVTVYFPESLLAHPAGKLLFSMLIIWTAFGFRSVTRFLKLLLLFYFVTFAVGGSLFAIHYMLQTQAAFTSASFLTVSTGYGDHVSWLFVAIMFPIALYFTKSRMDKQRFEQFRYDQLHNVQVSINGIAHKTEGFIDSGNHLSDPLTKRPVVICDQLFLRNWFTEEEWQLLAQANSDLDLDLLPKDWPYEFSVVPYQGVNGEGALMLVLKPDSILIEMEQVQIETDRVWIGIQFGNLTADRRYHCLLHPSLVHDASTQAG
ncbi:sigma-E processing peptidase SpoIIGA [Virgibacillus sp. 7505]|uniref:sigma-E processing peptidase SpoIIGA n=1 Tax=Virgibacillus sp. 7505 TaxID=2022548 RepID=UPI000BA4FDCF|nr:sigma-E processing peptidase SpoIIGA [Virgibacillus sp. 7505]PAE16695.1 sigma-E processing peptidase SpoIIGA [Virgibacillus sp. 7505]